MTAAGPVPNAGQVGTEATASRHVLAAAAVTVSGDAGKSEAAGRAGEKRAGAPHKWLIAGSVILGPVLEVLDSSIVNVSLPHMQGSFSASVDEVAWVVTSYLVANGVMIPVSYTHLTLPTICSV